MDRQQQLYWLENCSFLFITIPQQPTTLYPYILYVDILCSFFNQQQHHFTIAFWFYINL
jgi:hypothetical protein